ncbi:tyrosine-type recombinase/integrase [Nonomuraea ceibae]|uniref:tyrosine-type recombinase/integrase n=1 Tax=Nonomuraea ceibae TaxID=1935170 RepID=UPI001C5DEC6D|nr:tyrosine-type recombinase/integrase [Nonomuraea ceibae]
MCGLYVEDLGLRLDDEHVRLHGKGGSARTVLLDDRGYVTLLKLYLARAGYTAGPLFRASINSRGGPLSYDAAHHRWQTYCTQARIEIDIHQLRHAHATELINAGAPLRPCAAAWATPPPKTTQLYALLIDSAERQYSITLDRVLRKSRCSLIAFMSSRPGAPDYAPSFGPCDAILTSTPISSSPGIARQSAGSARSARTLGRVTGTAPSGQRRSRSWWQFLHSALSNAYSGRGTGTCVEGTTTTRKRLPRMAPTAVYTKVGSWTWSAPPRSRRASGSPSGAR